MANYADVIYGGDGDDHLNLGVLLDIARRPDEAARSEGQAVAMYEGLARDHYTAALLAGCVRLAAGDDRLADVERQEVAAGYGDDPLVALRRAINLKAKEVAQLGTDPAFAPLRSRPDFRSLWQEREADRRP